MTDSINIFVAIAVFGGCFYLATDIRTRPSQIIADAFHQLPAFPARGAMCLPQSSNIEDRRDPIAVLIENN